MYRRILLPIDLGHVASNDKVISIAVEMARHWQGEIHAVTVVPPISSMVAPYLPQSVEMDTVHDVEARLTDLLKASIPDDIKVSLRVVEGAVYHEILHEAKKWQADVIVIASHKPELGDYLLGSNAAKVVRHAPMSVFVVRL
ncbi:universal stress protein [Magnetovibrio sp.]|uniref:universal stress protein n=1 Tax=Magnetovibrio sp. TaxID=2024836 RepID=UPI002F93F412